jgi:hypothetical protein
MKLAPALTVLLCLAGGPALAELELGVHTDEPAPTVAALMGSLQPQGENITVRAFSDASALTAALATGEIDLALLEETASAVPGITSVADLYPGVLHILYRSIATPANVGELLSLGPVWAGAPGGIGYRLAQGLAVDYGLQDLELLADPWSKAPAVYFIFGGLLTSDALSRLEGFRLYSLGAPEALMHGSVAEGMVLRYPNLRPFILPAELYPTIGPQAVLTLSVNTLLAAHAGLDENLIYELALGSARLAPAVAAHYPLAGLPQMEDLDRAARVLPWHPGAQRYRDRDLPGFLERFAERIGLLLTLIIALGSVAVAVQRRRKQGRKDRLDQYYQRVLACRSGAAGNATQGENAKATIRAIQAEVFELVVAERIDADSALVAFLALSNQLLAESDSHTLEYVEE